MDRTSNILTLKKRDRNPKILSRMSLKHLKLLILMFRYPLLYKLYIRLIHKFRNKKLESPFNNKIYAGHGSIMIFTQTFVQNHIDFKFPSFLFGEEIFFGELVRQSGLEVEYIPDIVVKDIDHASTGKLKRKLYYKLNYDSLNMIKKLFYDE